MFLYVSLGKVLFFIVIGFPGQALEDFVKAMLSGTKPKIALR